MSNTLNWAVSHAFSITSIACLASFPTSVNCLANQPSMAGGLREVDGFSKLSLNASLIAFDSSGLTLTQPH